MRTESELTGAIGESIQQRITTEAVGVGVEMIREWLGWNWSEIRDGGEPGIRELARALISLGRNGESIQQRVEITPEMVQAGVVILRESGRLTSEANGPDEVLVEDILRASLHWDRDAFGARQEIEA